MYTLRFNRSSCCTSSLKCPGNHHDSTPIGIPPSVRITLMGKYVKQLKLLLMLSEVDVDDCLLVDQSHVTFPEALGVVTENREILISAGIDADLLMREILPQQLVHMIIPNEWSLKIDD